MSNQGHWLGEKADPYNYFGFIYIIRDLTTGRNYVGKKQYWLSTKAKRCKGKITDRQSEKWKCRCWKESDWRSYKGSSKSLNKWMKENPDNDYDFIILYQCRSKGILHYKELKELWERDVLATKMESGDYLYFNRSIGAIKFRPPEFVSKKTRELQSESRKGVPNNKEVVHIINRETEVEMKGTRLSLAEQTGLVYQSLVCLANKDLKSLHGWVLYERKDEEPVKKRGSYSEEWKEAISKGLLASDYEVTDEQREKQSINSRGGKNANAKLKESEVLEILDLLSSKSNKEIAEAYSVSSLSISKIRTGRTWRYLSDGE